MKRSSMYCVPQIFPNLQDPKTRFKKKTKRVELQDFNPKCGIFTHMVNRLDMYRYVYIY